MERCSSFVGAYMEEPSQVIASSNEDDNELELEDVGEREVLRQTRYGEKAPANIGLAELWCNNSFEEALVTKVPDLEEYFSEFDTDAWDRIRLCRTYANYLAQKTRQTTKRVKKE
jgi:hypothetical protein